MCCVFACELTDCYDCDFLCCVTHLLDVTGHAIKHAIEKAGIEKSLVDDVILGCGMPEGETGMNVARNSALW